MSSAKHSTRMRNPYVLVLWGQNFDAVAASAFVAEFRRAGVRTKIVGVHGPSVAGNYDLMLRTDMLLGNAVSLVDNTLCVVLPCDLAAAIHLPDTPRLIKFFASIAESGAQLVTSSPTLLSETELGQIQVAESQWQFYQVDEVQLAASTIARDISGQFVFG